MPPKAKRKKDEEDKKLSLRETMRAHYTNHSCRLGRGISAVICCLLPLFFFTGGQAYARINGNIIAEGQSSQKIKAAALPASVAELEKILSGSNDPFVYKREGRSDPFMPFITETIVQADIESELEELTGMRKFEPGQLTLVALLFSEEGPMAMVQDSSGKGYIIKEGTLIGRRGTVDQIKPNTVIIKKMTRTTSGQVRTHTVEMVLKKEGEM